MLEAGCVTRVLNVTRRRSARTASALAYCSISRPTISRNSELLPSVIAVNYW